MVTLWRPEGHGGTQQGRPAAPLMVMLGIDSGTSGTSGASSIKICCISTVHILYHPSPICFLKCNALAVGPTNLNSKSSKLMDSGLGSFDLQFQNILAPLKVTLSSISCHTLPVLARTAVLGSAILSTTPFPASMSPGSGPTPLSPVSTSSWCV